MRRVGYPFYEMLKLAESLRRDLLQRPESGMGYQGWRSLQAILRLPDQRRSRMHEMRIRLAERWTKRLLELPESGMGYQRVDIRLADGRELRDGVVFNAEKIEVPNDFAQAEIKDVRLHAA